MAAPRPSKPRSVSDALDGVVRSLQGGRRHPGSGANAGAAAVGGVFGRWGEIVGEAMALHVQPVMLDGGRLLVEVREPAWATQVRMLNDQLLGRIKDVAGIDIEALDVRVAGANPRRSSRR